MTRKQKFYYIWAGIILLLGMLVYGTMTVKVIGPHKASLDKGRLSKFIRGLEETMKNPESRQAIRDLGEFPTSRDLFFALYENELIPLEDLQLLAGVSGIDYELGPHGEKPPIEPDNIIFTSANSGEGLVDLYTGRTETHGVWIIYNKHHIDRYPEYKVLAFSGELRAEYVYDGNFEEPFRERGLSAPKFDPNNPKAIYGIYPLKGIAPE